MCLLTFIPLLSFPLPLVSAHSLYVFKKPFSSLQYQRYKNVRKNIACARVRAYKHTFSYIYTYACERARKHTHTHSPTHIRVRARTHSHAYIYTLMYANKQACAHTLTKVLFLNHSLSARVYQSPSASFQEIRGKIKARKDLLILIF